MVCVPCDGVMVFDSHLAAAGGPTTDERGCTVDLRVRMCTSRATPPGLWAQGRLP